MPLPPDTIRPISWQGDHLLLLDQRLLPQEQVFLRHDTAAQVADSIRRMVVRGAPAIGIAAAWGLVLSARTRVAEAGDGWHAGVVRDATLLRQARPTAVNLAAVLDQLLAVVRTHPPDPVGLLTEEARRVQEEDLARNRIIGRLGADLVPYGTRILTHCNTGSLATGGLGTALGILRTAWADGRLEAVYADETRPWLQGSRLTAWELARDGIPVTLLPDSAAPWLMRTQKIGCVVVGADRIAANGDTANKIGTYALAVAARAHGVRFIVAATLDTVDPATPSGEGIPIEERDPDEVLEVRGVRVAAEGARAWNPAFDVTPADLVDWLVTEAGAIERPDRAGIEALLRGRRSAQGL